MCARVTSPAPKNSTEAGLQVLWADAHLLAVCKPAGMPVQPDRGGDPDLLTAVRTRHPGEAIGLPHRLDRPVSGVVLLARTAPALAALDRAFRERTVAKTYLAVVTGAVAGDLHLEHRLVHDARHRRARLAGDGILARIHVHPLHRGDRYTLVEVVPQGGAFHQIRAQLAAAGHAIKGDVKYGARRGERDRSIALHALRIALPHPFTGERLCVEAPLPGTPTWAPWRPASGA